LHNATELLRDAEGLAVFGRYPRAYSLAVLAAEELGKHMMCFGAVGRDLVDPEAWPAFWREFNSHAPKYENAVLMAMSFLEPEVAQEFGRQFREHVTGDQKARLAGLYVDWREGEIVTPDQAVPPQLVFDVLTVFGAVIHAWADRWSDTDFGQMFADGESKAAVVQAAIVTGHLDVLEQAFRETLDGPGEPGSEG